MSASSSQGREKKAGSKKRWGATLKLCLVLSKPEMKAVRPFYQGLIGARAKRLETKRGKTRRTPNERKKKEKKCTVVFQGFLDQTEVGRVKDAA